VNKKTKICSKCGVEQSLENFYKEKRNSDGLRTDCKKCCRIRSKNYVLNHKDEVKKYQREYRENNKQKRINYQKQYWPKYYQNNKEAIAEKNRIYFQSPAGKLAKKKFYNSDKGKISEKIKRYKKRSILENLDEHFTAQDWKEVLAEYGKKCLACGSTEHLTVDHVIPLSQGGTNTKDNLQPLCLACNCSKGVKTIDYRIWI